MCFESCSFCCFVFIRFRNDSIQSAKCFKTLVQPLIFVFCGKFFVFFLDFLLLFLFLIYFYLSQLTCSTMLFAFFILTIVLIAKVLLSFNQRESKRTKDEKESEDTLELKLKTQLNHIFSFAVIGDTKFVGLFIFLLSNLFTGIVNLSINTLKISDPTAFIILSIYTFLCFLLPFLFHFYTFPNQQN